MTQRDRRSVRRQEEGLAVVEAAIVLVLVLMLLLGAVEYGWMFYCMQVINHAAQEGVREAILPDATDASVGSVVSAALAGGGLSGVGQTVEVAAEGAAASVGAIAVSSPITVTVRVPYANVSAMDSALFPTPAELRAAVTMTKEGPT